MELQGKKLLILGAYSTEIEIINEAKKQGIYTIVTDNHHNWDEAPAKKVADEAWNISWSDIDRLRGACQEKGIDGCIAGFSERRIICAQQLCNELGLPFYSEGSDLNVICNKVLFKQACIKSGVSVPRSFNYTDNIEFPVIVKPADNAGSRGISICYNNDELEKAYNIAIESSELGSVLIEEYLTSDEVMIYFTVHDSVVELSAMCDRYMQKFSNNITQLPVGYCYKSKHLDVFIKYNYKRFVDLIHNLGIRNGLIAFQAFVKGTEIIPFDPTYRLDGTMTYHTTEHENGISALSMLINYSLTGSMGESEYIKNSENPEFLSYAFELPVLLTKGTINSVRGLESIANLKSVIHIFQNRKIMETMDKIADFSQIFCRIHICAASFSELKKTISYINEVLHICDENGNEMIIGRFNPNQLNFSLLSNFAVIGAGCVGSTIAERLYNSGYNVSLIATGQHAQVLEQEGIYVNNKKYKFPIMKNSTKKPDVVFVCVKNYDLETALYDMKEFIDQDTIILPLLNSVSPTPTIQEAFPNNKVLYGYITKIDTYKDELGYHYNIIGEIHFGYAENKQISDELSKLAYILRSSGFSVEIDEDMVRGIWKKWMLNVGANQVSALTEADYLKFSGIPEIEYILRLAMQELLLIASYEKVNLSTLDISDIINYLTTYPYPKKTSMLQDILARRRTEIDYIAGDILKYSQKWNCPCPVNLTMYYLIKSKEKAYLQE